MIFEVTPEHIEVLTDTDLRTLVGYLAEREVVNASHSASSVTYGGHQNTTDGGIDVRVALDFGTINGFIPRLACGFQVKAENFAPSDIKKEMRPGGKLRESIRALGGREGAYVIVSSKSSVSDLGLETRRRAMKDALADEPGVRDLLVDFYDQQRLASWVNQHPGLITWTRSRVGCPIAGWRPFEDWSSSPTADDSLYILDDGVRLLEANQHSKELKVEEGIDRLRSILRKSRGIVRLIGLSGVGKTRLVQALFDERLGNSPLSRHLAIYTDIGENPNPAPREMLDKLQNLDQKCVLIVDNCGAELHRRLAGRLPEDSSISLITIEYDIDDEEAENTEVFKLEPASKEVIEKVLKPRFLNLIEPEVRTIADFAEGNFRIALALAHTSKTGQSLANLKDKELFNRLFKQKNENNPPLLQAAKVCSLVYSFNFETLTGKEAELPLLAPLAGQTVVEFSSHVAELKRRQLVQARSKWRALLPHALAHRLAKQAFEDIPIAHLMTFIDAATERLLKSFSRRLGCLHDCSSAQRIVNEWLADGGLLFPVEQLNKLGMVLLDNVAPVDPEAVLRSIERAAETQLNFCEANSNADGLVRILRLIAYEPLLFSRANKLLVRFASFKTTSRNSGDAVNIFKSLFYIQLSGTHASPKQRADFARELAGGGTDSDEALALIALDAMLECGRFSSSYGFEFGTRKRDYGFRPTTWGEQWNWYAEAFLLARDLAKIGSLRLRVRTMVVSSFRYLTLHVRLDDLIALAEEFTGDGGWPEGWIGVRGALREAEKADHKEGVEKLARLERKLAPNSLAERLAIYVLPNQWGSLDFAEIDIGDEERHEKARKKIDEICQQIGSELTNERVDFSLYLPKLLESGSSRVFTVAKVVGSLATDPEQIWEEVERYILVSGHDGNFYNFLGGFLIGVSENDKEYANKLLDKIAITPRLHPFLPHVQSCVGVDSVGVRRLIEVIPSSSLPAWTLRQLALGRSTDNLDGDEFKQLVFAVAAKEDGLDVAVEILYMRIFSLRTDRKIITIVEQAVATELLASVKFENRSNLDSYRLAEIVKYCLRGPEDTNLAKLLCQRILGAIENYSISPSDYNDLVLELTEQFPRVVLDELVELEGSKVDTRRGLFGSFREQRPCPLRKIDDDQLLSWAHEKPEIRFTALAASIVGWHGSETKQDYDKSPDRADVIGLNWTLAAWRLIHEAREPIPVLEKFLSRFRPSSWSGSLADLLVGREPLLETLALDPVQSIADWARNALAQLREETNYLRKFDADRVRDRDQRFDW